MTNAILLNAIKFAWEGKSFDEIEVLTGKRMKPSPGMNKTVLVGQFMYAANKDNPAIKELIPIKGCPPSKESLKEGLEKAGIDLPEMFYSNIDKGAGLFVHRYRGKLEFHEQFFQVS